MALTDSKSGEKGSEDSNVNDNDKEDKIDKEGEVVKEVPPPPKKKKASGKTQASKNATNRAFIEVPATPPSLQRRRRLPSHNIWI